MIDPYVFSLPNTSYARALGNKQYEITDHLSNVRAVVYDYKEEQLNGEVQSVLASTKDYWPYAVPPTCWWVGGWGGMPLKRGLSGVTSGNQEEYEYNFQGQMSNDEVYGKGNLIDYKYRMHDARIGRFFTVDPLSAKYPYNSNYAFSENRVIDAIELEGLESSSYIDKNTNVFVPAIDNTASSIPSSN